MHRNTDLSRFPDGSFVVLLTDVLVGLSVDQAVGVPPPCARHPEQEGVGLDHVAVTRLKFVAGDQ